MYSFYGIKETIYEGNPVLELLQDGKPIFEEAGVIKRLRFGIMKAKMIINTMVQIEIFFNSKGAKPPKDLEIYIPPSKYNILCYCKKYFGFKIKDFEIERPYLRIWNNYAKFGFGLVKAEALIVLKGQIEDFIRKNDNRRWL